MTKIFNLIAQDDARATIELAQRSTTISDRSNDIAQDTLGQSTAMMTIATMTLVFLPATFISVSIVPYIYTTPAKFLLCCSRFLACHFSIGMQ